MFRHQVTVWEETLKKWKREREKKPLADMLEMSFALPPRLGVTLDGNRTDAQKLIVGRKARSLACLAGALHNASTMCFQRSQRCQVGTTSIP